MPEEVVDFVASTPAEPVAPPADPAAPIVESSADVVIPETADDDKPHEGNYLLPAVQKLRAEKAVLKSQLAAAQPTVQWAQQNKPVMDFINQHPELLQPRAPATAAVPVGVDPELAELARLMDYYKADGTPDLERAGKMNSIIANKATKMAREMVEPVAGTILHQQMERNWATAVAEKLPDGRPIDTALLTDAWRAVQGYQNGSGILADPKAVKVIVNTVKMQMLEQPGQLPNAPAAPGRPPVVTEGQGTRPANMKTRNETEKMLTGDRMDDKKFHDYTKDFRPGRSNVLED